VADHDDRIARLYQLPLDEFTAARNALAKETGDAAIKKLEKPNLAAWTVNQLYWHERRLYDAVIAAAEAMRTAYKQMLAGKSADVRAAEGVHADALRDAKQAAREILVSAGNTNPDTVMMAVAETLDALPGDEPPGRLTKPLRRMGFNVLEGLPIAAKVGSDKPKPVPTLGAPPPTAKERRVTEAEQRELEMNRERLRFAEAAERDATEAVERAKRALDRAAKTRERVEAELAQAAAAETAAARELSGAESAHAKAQAEVNRLTRKISG
jgi:hypothetical protein